MAFAASFSAIRCLRRTEDVGAAKAVLESVLVTLGMAVTAIFVVAVVVRSLR